MVPYVTCYRPRKIGNVPAQYVIRRSAFSGFIFDFMRDFWQKLTVEML